jgi:hypothetical protein
MAHQFFHVETYGLHARHKLANAAGVIAEVERKPTHSLHVKAPRPVKLLLGCNPSDLLAELQLAASQAKDRAGKRKLPKDAQILLAGIVSMPMKTSQLLAAHEAFVAGGKKDKPEALRTYDRWQRLTLEFLRTQYGDGLRSVALHYDENYPHVHFFAANKLTNGTLNLDGLDVAADAERTLGLDRKTRNAAGAARRKVRAQALVKLQDKYYEAVSKPMGWLRSGPKLGRMTRQQYLRQKEAAKEVGVLSERLETASAEVASLQGRLKSSRRMYVEVVERVTPQLAELSNELRSLHSQPDQEKLVKAESSLRKLSDDLKPRPAP